MRSYSQDVARLLFGMLSTTLRSVFPARPPARHTLVNLYTTVADLTRTQWRTGGHPAPQSVAEDDDEDWPAPQKEEYPALERDIEDAEESLSSRPLPHRPYPRAVEKRPTPQPYAAHRETMKKKFPEGWSPPRKISREAMDAMRQLHRADPHKFPTPVLADRFRISAEAVRRILRSKWEPTREERVKMAARERDAKRTWKDQKREEELKMHETLEQERLHSRRSKQEDEFTLR